MSDDEIGQRGRDLLRSLDSHEEPPEEVRERLRARIAATLAAPQASAADPEPSPASEPAAPATVPADAASALASAAGVSRTLAALLTLGGVVIGGAAGAWLHATLAEPRVIVREVPIERADADAGAPVDDAGSVAGDVRVGDDAGIAVASAVESTGEGTRAVDAGPAPSQDDTETSTGDERRAERALLRQAQAALARSSPLDALDALRTHRRRFARTEFAEERDALEVQALFAAGESARAAEAARRFVEHYPHSLFLPRVRPALP